MGASLQVWAVLQQSSRHDVCGDAKPLRRHPFCDTFWLYSQTHSRPDTRNSGLAAASEMSPMH